MSAEEQALPAPESGSEHPAAVESEEKPSLGRLDAMATGATQSHLAVQDLATLDVSQLSPHTPEVISRQATIIIGTIGLVAHG